MSGVLLDPPVMITQTGTSQTTQIPRTQTQFSAPSTPQFTPFFPPPITTIPPVGSGLPVGAMVAIVTAVLIVVVLILVFILTLALRRMAKKRVQMVNSQDKPVCSGKEN